MPNFKAEYTLEMVLDLIEADLHKEGFDLSDAPITFHLNELDRASLILDIVKTDRNAIPSFLDTLNYPQEVKQALLGPAPTTEPASEPEPAPKAKKAKKAKKEPISTEAPYGIAKNGKPYKYPPTERELTRRANISALMTQRRADEKAAKEAKKLEETTPALLDPTPVPVPELVPVPVPELVPAPDPTPETTPQPELRGPADNLVPPEKRPQHRVEQEERQRIFEQRMKELNGTLEVVAPATPTFPGARQ